MTNDKLNTPIVKAPAAAVGQIWHGQLGGVGVTVGVGVVVGVCVGPGVEVLVGVGVGGLVLHGVQLIRA